jgi:hypothetical protein
MIVSHVLLCITLPIPETQTGLRRLVVAHWPQTTEGGEVFLCLTTESTRESSPQSLAT